MAILRFKKESKFTYKNFLDLNDRNKAYASPLAVICHIDLNAFFAQCEQLRLGLSDSDPVVCLQWNSLIAVSYAARDYGITRMDRLEQAKLKCPNLIPVHTAVFKKGEPVWKYVDYIPSPANHKVSLDPYRREGKKILSIFQNACDLVEKASVDESFMDIGRLVFKRINELFPDLLDSMNDVSDNLKVIEELPAGVDFKGYVIAKTAEKDLDLDTGIADKDHDYLVEDWDDLVILVGSMICFELRQRVFNELGYKTSGGVGKVKTIAKLASDFQKPDQQTIVRNDSIPNFLKNFKLTDFWSLGGKTGNYIKDELGDGDLITRIRENFNSPAALAKNLSNNLELAQKLYSMVRGDYATQIEPKPFIKTMSSNKNFRGSSVSNTNEFIPWIKVFIGELILRTEELDQETNTIIRPTKLTLSALSPSGARHSKQCTLNQVPKDYTILQKLFYENSLSLLTSLEKMWEDTGSKMYPLRNASLTISGFTDGGNNTLDDLMPTVKKRKKYQQDITFNSLPPSPPEDLQCSKKSKKSILDAFLDNELKLKQENSCDIVSEVETIPTCPKCGDYLQYDEIQPHLDYHLAVEIEQKMNKDFEESYAERLLKKKTFSKRNSKNRDKNQSRLPF